MTLRLGALHDALLKPGDALLAREAAEEVATYQERMASIDTRLTVLTWMVTLSITLQLLTLGGMLGLIWRWLPAAK